MMHNAAIASCVCALSAVLSGWSGGVRYRVFGVENVRDDLLISGLETRVG